MRNDPYHYKFASFFPLSISLVGDNNTSIVFEELVYLTIEQQLASEFNWAWIDFTIIHVYYSFFDVTSRLWHINTNSLAIRNCKLIAFTLKITNTGNVVIDSSEFRGNFGKNSLCPSITVMSVSQFIFSNNKFSTCTFQYYEAVVQFDITEHDSNLTIIKCTFTEVIGYRPAYNINNQDKGIFSVNTEKDVTSVLTINESRFIRNSKVKLLTVHALPEKANYHVSVILTGLDIINNAGTSALVEINC